MKPHWTDVFPAITTQMNKSGAIALNATARHAEVLITSGVSALVFPMTGYGKRLVFEGGERKGVLRIIHDGIATRPKLPRAKSKTGG